MYFIFSFWPLFAAGQVYTGFESGLGTDWEQFPADRWESSPEQAIFGSGSLHHSFDSDSSCTDRISLKTGIYDLNDNISWEFIIKHAYTPSGSNKWAVFPASEKGANEIPANGFAVGVNITGTDDTLRLYEITGGKYRKLCTTNLNYEKDIGSNAFKCRIQRDPANGWSVYGGFAQDCMKLLGTAKEQLSPLADLKYFMLSYTYTSSKDRLLWFDELRIDARFVTDTIPPIIKSFTVPDQQTIIIEVPGDLDTADINDGHFALLPGNFRPVVTSFRDNYLTLHFAEDFAGKIPYSLIISGLKDLENNIMEDDTINFIFYKAVRDDLIISEIMADPSPKVLLAEAEYIELYNRSDFPVDIGNFLLVSGSKDWELPEYTVQPDDYLVLSGAEMSGEKVIPVFTSKNVIPNDGTQILLKDREENLITAAEFSSEWYRDGSKAQGGWSLERIETDDLCGGKENWRVSEDHSGGTPGRVNSVNDQLVEEGVPEVEQVEFSDAGTVRLVFSRNVDPKSIPEPGKFSVMPGTLHPDSIITDDLLCKYADLQFPFAFESGVLYELEIPNGIKDCKGEALIPQEKFYFGTPSEIQYTDIVISVVMYSAKTGCGEYIEICNISEHIADLSDLLITSGNRDDLPDPVYLLSQQVLIMPKEYKVFCRDRDALMSCYELIDSRCVVESDNFPSLRDEGSCISLLNRSLVTIDQFCYDPGMQFPLLADDKGVSLERLRLDRNTGDESQWHSASSLSGYGTPGKENSQAVSGSNSGKKLELKPETFSPDNDGRDDILEIRYSLDREGYTGTFAVFDPEGRIVKILADNEILGTLGVFLWDGRNAAGSLCNTGLYMIYAEIWSTRGDRARLRDVAVLVKE
jgi:hypothetical protein